MLPLTGSPEGNLYLKYIPKREKSQIKKVSSFSKGKVNCEARGYPGAKYPKKDWFEKKHLTTLP